MRRRAPGSKRRSTVWREGWQPPTNVNPAELPADLHPVLAYFVRCCKQQKVVEKEDGQLSTQPPGHLYLGSLVGGVCKEFTAPDVLPMDQANWMADSMDEQIQGYLQLCLAHTVNEFMEAVARAIVSLIKRDFVATPEHPEVSMLAAWNTESQAGQKILPLLGLRRTRCSSFLVLPASSVLDQGLVNNLVYAACTCPNDPPPAKQEGAPEAAAAGPGEWPGMTEVGSGRQRVSDGGQPEEEGGEGRDDDAESVPGGWSDDDMLDGLVAGGGVDEETDDERSFVIAQVESVMPVDKLAADMISTLSISVNGQNVDTSAVVLGLNAALPRSWLPPGAGGMEHNEDGLRESFMSPLLFVQPFKSIFSGAARLMQDVQRQLLTPSSRALLETIVTGYPAFDTRPPLALQPTSEALGPAHAMGDTEAGQSGVVHSTPPGPRGFDPNDFAAAMNNEIVLDSSCGAGGPSADAQMHSPHAVAEWDNPHGYLLFERACLRASEAILGHRCNHDQEESVEELKAGVFIIHGPPGTGKSTTIFHIINTRIMDGSPTLVTACRNAALEALLVKLKKGPRLLHRMVVYGQPERIGPACLPFQLRRLAMMQELHGWSMLHLLFCWQRGAETTATHVRAAATGALSSAVQNEMAQFLVGMHSKTFEQREATEHLGPNALDDLLSDARLQGFDPMPEWKVPERPSVSAGVRDMFVLRKYHLRLLQMLMKVVNCLNVCKVIWQRDLKLCTVDSVASFLNAYKNALMECQRQLVPQSDGNDLGLHFLRHCAGSRLKRYTDANGFKSTPAKPLAGQSPLPVKPTEWLFPLQRVPPVALELLLYIVSWGVSAKELPGEDVEAMVGWFPRLHDVAEEDRRNKLRNAIHGMPSLAEHRLHIKHALKHYRLHPRDHAPLLRDWLRRVMLYQLGRGQHRWLFWKRDEALLFGAQMPHIGAAWFIFNSPLGEKARAMQELLLEVDTGGAVVEDMDDDRAAGGGRAAGRRVVAPQREGGGATAPRAFAGTGQTAAGGAAAVRDRIMQTFVKLDTFMQLLIVAGGLYSLATSSTLIAETLYHFEMAQPHAAAVQTAAEGCHLRQQCDEGTMAAEDAPPVWSARAMVEDVADALLKVQLQPEMTQHAWQEGTLLGRVLLPVNTVVMDEAACSTDYGMPALLVLRPSNMILIGDPRQLEAHSEFHNTHQPTDRNGLAESMMFHNRSTMERLTLVWEADWPANEEHGIRMCHLQTQYRMHPSICNLVGAHFYCFQGQSQLVTAESVAQQRTSVASHHPSFKQRFPTTAVEWLVVHNLESMSHWGLPDAPAGAMTAHEFGYSNVAEAFVAVMKAKDLFTFLNARADAEGWTAADRAAHFHGTGPVDGKPFWPRIFVLSQYSAQVRLLRALLLNDGSIADEMAANIEAKTIDSCQGDEADGVVLSLTMTYEPLQPDAAGAPPDAWMGHADRPAPALPVLSLMSMRSAADVTPTDFMQYRNRVNVAISRTRYMLAIVSSACVVESMNHPGNLTTWGRLLTGRGGGRKPADRIVMHEVLGCQTGGRPFLQLPAQMAVRLVEQSSSASCDPYSPEPRELQLHEDNITRYSRLMATKRGGGGGTLHGRVRLPRGPRGGFAASSAEELEERIAMGLNLVDRDVHGAGTRTDAGRWPEGGQKPAMCIVDHHDFVLSIVDAAMVALLVVLYQVDVLVHLVRKPGSVVAGGRERGMAAASLMAFEREALRDLLVEVITIQCPSAMVTSAFIRQLLDLPLFAAERRPAASTHKDGDYPSHLFRCLALSIIDFYVTPQPPAAGGSEQSSESLLQRQAKQEGRQVASQVAFRPACGTGTMADGLQSAALRWELQRMFMGRLDAGKTLVFPDELLDICLRSAPVFERAIGMLADKGPDGWDPTSATCASRFECSQHGRSRRATSQAEGPSDEGGWDGTSGDAGARHQVAPDRWGRVPNLFQAALGVDDYSLLQASARVHACHGRADGPVGAEVRVQQPQLFFAQDWPMWDVQWRQVPQHQWNNIEHVLDALQRDSPAVGINPSMIRPLATDSTQPVGWEPVEAKLSRQIQMELKHRHRKAANGRREAYAQVARKLQDLVPSLSTLQRKLLRQLTTEVKSKRQHPHLRKEALRTLLVEGAEAVDLAVCVAHKHAKEAQMEEDAAHPKKAAKLVLLTRKPAWLQLLNRRDAHLLDVFGALDRPEWPRPHECTAGGDNADSSSAVATEADAATQQPAKPLDNGAQGPGGHSSGRGGGRGRSASQSGRRGGFTRNGRACDPGGMPSLSAFEQASAHRVAALTAMWRSISEPLLHGVDLDVTPQLHHTLLDVVLQALRQMLPAFLPAHSRRGAARQSTQELDTGDSDLQAAFLGSEGMRTRAMRDTAALLANYACCHDPAVLPVVVCHLMDHELYSQSWNNAKLG